jgi:citrate lyase beta subunit
MSKLKSWLCSSVFNEQLVDKCIKYNADVIHYDIEDSVPNEQKEKARFSLEKI